MQNPGKNPLKEAEEKMKGETRLLEAMIIIAIIGIIVIIFWSYFPKK